VAISAVVWIKTNNKENQKSIPEEESSFEYEPNASNKLPSHCVITKVTSAYGIQDAVDRFDLNYKNYLLTSQISGTDSVTLTILPNTRFLILKGETAKIENVGSFMICLYYGEMYWVRVKDEKGESFVKYIYGEVYKIPAFRPRHLMDYTVINFNEIQNGDKALFKDSHLFHNKELRVFQYQDDTDSKKLHVEHPQELTIFTIIDRNLYQDFETNPKKKYFLNCQNDDETGQEGYLKVKETVQLYPGYDETEWYVEFYRKKGAKAEKPDLEAGRSKRNRKRKNKQSNRKKTKLTI
jgi:hypothetical protein